MAQIKRFGVWRTAELLAILYCVCTAVVMVPFGLLFLIVGLIQADLPGLLGAALGGVFMAFMPS